MKSKKRWLVTALTACLTLSLGICAEALEYDFDGVEDTEYYPSTSYESLYGAKYNYGGSNATDYQWPALPYGVSSNTSVGCMEKVRFPGLVGSIGGSGIESNITNPIQQEPQIPSTSYQPSAYTSVDGMERKDGSIGTLKIPSLNINMKVPKGISELHDEAEEAAEYSVDLSEEPEAVPSESTPISSTEESDWGVQEPKKEIAEEKVLAPALEASVSVEPPKAAPKSDRQLFYELKFNNLDRGLTPEERQEWNSIYASYRGRSAITGTIIGVDPHSIYVWNPETERREKKTMYCAIVVPYRVRIVIPASEMWEAGNERPDYVLQNMVGASIDLVIIKVEREAGFAIGSRRLASRSQRYFFAHREDLHRIGSRVKCRMLAVGPRRCLVDCYGHDLDLTQREMRYAAIPDLRDEYHPGMELESVVKVYDPAKDELVVSIKETETNPTLGAERRHPVGSRRLAVISGKYGGGVFCNLPDGVVCMCNYSFQHEDSDFMVGENVMLVVQRYNEEKLQMFGKILSKW